MYDAEGSYDNDRCPKCGSLKTITYRYEEGFSEIECETCGFHSDASELSDLGRYRGDLPRETPQRPTAHPAQKTRGLTKNNGVEKPSSFSRIFSYTRPYDTTITTTMMLERQNAEDDAPQTYTGGTAPVRERS